MIDAYTASRIARMEHEELVRSLAPVYDYDEWLTDKAGNWQARGVGTLFSALGRGLVGLGTWLQRKSEAVPESLPAAQEPSSVAG